MQKGKALIAMSGGVDSSVTAYLMQEAGYDCIGATMKLIEKAGAQTDADEARTVADRLGMDFHVFDFTALFKEQVIDPFVRCYECGLTPNPCVDCNRHLKFQALYDRARLLGCDCIATGHYASIRFDGAAGRWLLYKAADRTKDQSYFLYTLSQEQLSHTLFPLGGLTKEAVRDIAAGQGFLNARKRDSQDICFIPDGKYMDFLTAYNHKTYAPGNFLDMDGKVIGTHQGAVAYTRGQRKGLGLAMGAPVYVYSKDMEQNSVTVCENDALFSRVLRADDWNFFPFDTLTAPIRVCAKTRSRMAEQPAAVYPEENGTIRVEFDEPQRAITTGQAVVLYDGDQVIGGGTITEVL